MTNRTIPVSALADLASLLAHVWGELNATESRALDAAINANTDPEIGGFSVAVAWLTSRGWRIERGAR